MISHTMAIFTGLHLLSQAHNATAHMCASAFIHAYLCRPNHLQLLHNRKTSRDSAALLHSGKGKFS